MPEENDRGGEGIDGENVSVREVDADDLADADAEDTNTGETDAPDDSFDRRVAPYSGETTASIDPVEPPERGEDDPIEPDVPQEAVDEAERLTRLARRVPDEEAATYRERRAELLAEYDYAAVLRDDAGESSDPPTLVCHPSEWRDGEGAIDPTRIDEIDRAAEVDLGTADDPDAWDAVAERNEAVVEGVRAAHGDVHAANAEAFAEYVSNHHAKPISAVTAVELRRFREEYYPVNAWPTDEQAAALEESIAHVYDELDVPMPVMDDAAE